MLVRLEGEDAEQWRAAVTEVLRILAPDHDACKLRKMPPWTCRRNMNALV